MSETAAGLLHVVGDDDDGVVLLQLVDQFLDRDRGDGVERGAGLVHEDDLGLDGDGPGDAEALLLAAGEAEARWCEAVLDLVPEAGAAEAPLDRFVEAGLSLMPVEAQAVGDVFVDRLRERVRLLEDHADALAQLDDVDGPGRRCPGRRRS